MGWLSRAPKDPVGQNPTGRPRKSSSGSRRKAERKLDRDLDNTKWEKKDD